MNDEFNNRREFIKKSNDLNKQADVKTFIEGNKKKVALDQRLDELSINNGVLVSGNIVRHNILNASSSNATTVNNYVDTSYYEDESKDKENETDDQRKRNRLLVDVNVGKEIASNIKNNSKININNINK